MIVSGDKCLSKNDTMMCNNINNFFKKLILWYDLLIFRKKKKAIKFDDSPNIVVYE